MTSPAINGPESIDGLEGAVEILHSHGLRLSTARRLVLETLADAEGPLTAEDISAGGGVLARSDLATVYRNLETLERIGIVRHMHLGHGPGRYEFGTERPCEHLLCESCGDHRAVDPAELEAVRRIVLERFGFRARFTHFPLCGLCADCARRQDVR